VEERGGRSAFHRSGRFRKKVSSSGGVEKTFFLFDRGERGRETLVQKIFAFIRFNVTMRLVAQ